MQGMFLPHTQCTRNRLRINHDASQDKTLTKDESVNELTFIQEFSQTLASFFFITLVHVGVCVSQVYEFAVKEVLIHRVPLEDGGISPQKKKRKHR